MSVRKEINETLLIKAEDLANRDVQAYDLYKKEKNDTYPLIYPNDITERISKSVFRMVYNQAFEQIALIVNNSLDKERQDIENIIAFAGRRGTGKTSAMYSLKNFLCNNEISFINVDEFSKTFKFVTLYDMKSSDLKDDIFEHIIEAVRYELDNFINNNTTNYLRFELDFDKAKILREKACLMEKEYCSFKNNNNISDFSYNSIMRTSNKQDMKQRFKELIKEYSNLLSEDKNVFFIICIDDLDMASDNSKKLVQDIYKYLMIPNLIIFVTSDFALLNSEIQKEFYENLCPIEDKGHIENLSIKQTHALLMKIIPSDNRITMPSWKKKDYIEMFPVKICFNKDKEDYFTQNFPRLKDGEFEKFIQKYKYQNNDYCISPKDFILMLIANRTKIYLDAKGYKYHFMEPDSLRNLYDMFYLLYNMNNLIPEYDDYSALKKEYYNAKKRYNKKTDMSKPEVIDKYERKISEYYYHRSENRKRLLDYIHFTMREDMSFSSEESDFIDMLLAQPVERRGKMIWERYFSILRTKNVSDKIKGTYGEEFYNEELAKSKIENYSFGELFRIIYTSTRLGVFGKKFVKFIIAIFAFSLPAFVEREKKEYRDHENKRESDKKYIPYRRLEDNFGYSFLGTWWDDLFVRNEYYIELEWGIIISIKALKDAFSSNIDNVENAITSLLYLLMLTSKKDNIIIKYEKNSNITIYSKPDPTAFIMNIMNIDARLKNKMFIWEYNEETGHGSETISIRDLIGKILEIANYKGDYEKKIDNKVEELKKNYKDCHLSNMFKHMDLLYNVIKRVVSKKLYTDSNSLSKNENTRFNGVAYALYKEFYDGIIEKLQENDEIYFANKQKPDETNIYFSERFENSSIVKFFKFTTNFNYSVGVQQLGIRLGALPVNTFHRRKSKTFEEYVKSIENNFKGDMGTDLVLLIKLRLYNYLDKRIYRTQEYKLNDRLYHYVLKKSNEKQKSDIDILNETIDKIKDVIKADYDN
jgi:hypothetical protein